MFVRKPELLVLDDLSSALDVETERQLWERVSESKEITCLVATHRRPALRRADHIIVLKTGASRRREIWTHCWQPARRCGVFGKASRGRRDIP